MRVQRGFDLDPSCKLWLPFYRYGGEQTKIRDMSGNNNHGTITGAIPATYPKLKGVELVTNGGMESGNPPTGWTAYSTPATFESSAVQKHLGAKSLHIVSDDANEGGSYVVSGIVAGKQYRVSGWVYGDGVHKVVFSAFTGFWIHVIINQLVMPASWSYAELIFTATDSDVVTPNIYAISQEAGGDIYFDDVSIQEVVSYEGIGWGFDGVDDNINIPSWGSTITGTIFSGLCWVRNTYRGANVSRIFYTYNAVGDKGFSFYLGATRILGIDIWSSDPAAYASTVSIQDDTWVCLGYVYDGTAKTVDFYVNGILQVQRDITTHGDLNSNTTAYVCCSVSASQYITGQIGEVLIFNRALSAQEIRNYYELTRSRYGV